VKQLQKSTFGHAMKISNMFSLHISLCSEFVNS
jgi:hypothetical protein